MNVRPLLSWKCHSSRLSVSASLPVCYLFVFLSFFVASCSDSHSFRLSGSIDNLHQADFYIYSTDNQWSQLDTIHVADGSFDWSVELPDEVTFYIVYPNLNEQVVFARPGDHVRFRGDANQLRSVSLKGNPDNDALTSFRLDNLNVSADSLNRAMRVFIRNHPDSRVSSYLQRQLTLSRNNSSRLHKGDKLPTIVLPSDTLGGDTLRLLTTDSTARPVLLFFWATWKGDSRIASRDIREALRRYEHLPKARRLQPISISLDFDKNQYIYSCRVDSIDYDRRRYPQMWDAPICEQLAIQHIPFYILADSTRKIIALGANWKEDILPVLNKLP